jgi:hypothetical protein
VRREETVMSIFVVGMNHPCAGRQQLFQLVELVSEEGINSKFYIVDLVVVWASSVDASREKLF